MGFCNDVMLRSTSRAGLLAKACRQDMSKLPPGERLTLPPLLGSMVHMLKLSYDFMEIVGMLRGLFLYTFILFSEVIS